MNDMNSEVPWWAYPLGDSEYKHFICCIDDYLKAKGAKYEIESDSIRFTEGIDSDFGNAVFGLMNLVQTCNASSMSDYQKIIESHFKTFFVAIRFDREFERQAGNLNAVKDYLAVRIYHTNFVESSTEDKLVYRELNESLREVLVFDLPSVVKPASQKYLSIWDTNIDELFDMGLKNVFSNYEFKIEEHDFDGNRVFIIGTDHFFATNILYSLDGNQELLGTYGSLISFPTRSIVFIYPIESKDAIFFSVRMTEVTESVYDDGPGSLCNRVFIYHDGRLEDANATEILLDGESARLLSSPALLNLMGEIPDEA
jgi:hypothetical protein